MFSPLRSVARAGALTLCVSFLAATAAAQVYVGAGGAIPDSVGATWPGTLPTNVLVSPIAIPHAVTSVNNVTLTSFTHTWLGDVHVVLEDPAGVRHNVLHRAGFTGTGFGNSGDPTGTPHVFVTSGGTTVPISGNMVAGTYNQSFGAWVAPGINNTPLSSLSGAAGNWTLYVYDWAGGDIGSIGAWSIDVTAPTPTQGFYSNGGLVTNPGAGLGGANVSQCPTSFNTAGYSSLANPLGASRYADDFTVTNPAGEIIRNARGFVYMTSTYPNPPVLSPVTGALVEIYNGNPSAGGIVIASSSTIIQSTWTGIYRVFNAALTNAQRPVFEVTVNMGAIVLPPGTYWISFTFTGLSPTSGTSGFSPMVMTVDGLGAPVVVAGNAVNFFGGLWTVVAGGTPLQGVEFPFELNAPLPPAAPFVYCTAKTTSNGCVPAISFTGVPTTSGAFTVSTTQNEPGVAGLFIYSVMGPASTPFEGGFLCMTPPVTRVGIQNAGGFNLCAGAFSFDFSAYYNGGADPALIPGTQVQIQCWSRDPGIVVPGTGTSLSDAVQAVLQ